MKVLIANDGFFLTRIAGERRRHDAIFRYCGLILVPRDFGLEVGPRTHNNSFFVFEVEAAEAAVGRFKADPYRHCRGNKRERVDTRGAAQKRGAAGDFVPHTKHRHAPPRAASIPTPRYTETHTETHGRGGVGRGLVGDTRGPAGYPHKTPRIVIDKKQARRLLHNFPPRATAVEVLSKEFSTLESSTPVVPDLTAVFNAVHDSIIIIKRVKESSGLMKFWEEKNVNHDRHYINLVASRGSSVYARLQLRQHHYFEDLS